MNSRASSDINRTKAHNPLTLTDVDSGVSHMYTLLDALETKRAVCPKVDEKGNSECPFAEDLYAEKEEAAKKVVDHLKKLRILLEVLEEGLANLRANLAKVESDSNSLHLESAKERYLLAHQGLERQIQKNLDRKKEILQLISRAKELLSLAAKKKWPLEKPKRRPVFPSVAPGSPSRTGFSIGREVDALLSLGPLRRGQPLVNTK